MAGAASGAGLWRQGLSTQSRQAYEKVLSTAPDDAEAREALGFVQLGGRWLTEEESYRARGFVKVDGEWLTPAEANRRSPTPRASRRARTPRSARRRRISPPAWTGCRSRRTGSVPGGADRMRNTRLHGGMGQWRDVWPFGVRR